MSKVFIEMKNVTKYYNKNIALSDFSLILNQPQVVGFFGPNGCQ